MQGDPDESRLSDAGRRVLRTLRAATTPQSVKDVATELDLHENTARFHLEALTRVGLAVRETERRVLRGRPRTLYAATSAGATMRNYQALASVLVPMVAEGLADPAGEAERAGDAWGRRLATRAARPGTSAAAVAGLAALLDDMGFAPSIRLRSMDSAIRRSAVSLGRKCCAKNCAAMTLPS
jgi:predicted ArsR family transcriptional regulator